LAALRHLNAVSLRTHRRRPNPVAPRKSAFGAAAVVTLYSPGEV
jgi:hypothetical protein